MGLVVAVWSALLGERWICVHCCGVTMANCTTEDDPEEKRQAVVKKNTHKSKESKFSIVYMLFIVDITPMGIWIFQWSIQLFLIHLA